MNKYRKDFPFFKAIDEHNANENNHLVYFDTSATAQRPYLVLNAMSHFYATENANPLRGLYTLSERATQAYEHSRETVAKFINAKYSSEIIFTRNTTESLNLVAYSYGLSNVKAGDEICITIMEHHSNIVPWQMVCRQTGAKLVYMECDKKTGIISDEEINSKITSKTKIVSCVHISNVLGVINPVKKIADRAHSVGAVMIVDGAQSTPHIPVDVQDLGADFFAMSGHKLCGPMGIGALYGRKELLEKMQSVRKSGLTFAPEAGTQRLRDVINKNVTEEEIMNTCRIAFEGGASAVKLYFMIGLPTETDEDIKGIAYTAQRIVDLFYSLPIKRVRGLNVTISLSTFVPKPFTPFQWEPQITLDEIERRQKLLIETVGRNKHIRVNYHDGKTSVLEGVFARGDRRLGKVIYNAYKRGCQLDGWNEHFKFDEWMNAIEEEGLTVAEYCNRKRDFDEPLPWDIINCGVSKAFLQRECEKAYRAETTPNCKEKCSGCGINKICKGDVCP